MGAMRRRVEGFVGLLARERRIQHQRAGKQKGNPQQAGTVAARFRRGGIEGKAEEHDDDQRENNRGAEKFARAKFEAQFLGQQDRSGARGVQLRLRPQRGEQMRADRHLSRYRAPRVRRRAKRRA